MKTIGLLGGMSWESTAVYYRLINTLVNRQLGALHSARILLHSFDFDDIAALQNTGDWQGAAAILADAGAKLETAGADVLLICTNTMHLVYPQVKNAVQIPVLHIADATALALRKQGFKTVGLLATSFTMEQDFYKARLREDHGIETLIPDAENRELVHRIIYDELCKGVILNASRDAFVQIIQQLVAAGAEAIILGCTEIGMLISQEDAAILLFDTAALHAEAAVRFSLGQADA